MGFLLEQTRPEADLEHAAREYVKRMIYRGEARWHPDLVTRQRITGTEHLEAARSLGRGVMVNYFHHGQYDGAFPSLARYGVTCQILVYPYMVREDAAPWMRQHVRVAGIGGGSVISAGLGTAGITELLTQGQVVAIATDVPGRTPVRFAGRDLMGSFGAARIAASTGSPVVVMTAERDEQGPLLRLHAPVDPADFDSPQGLLAHLVRCNEKAVLDWPEAYDLPRQRWGFPETGISA